MTLKTTPASRSRLFLDLELFAAGASQLVELGAEIVLRHAPFGRDPPYGSIRYRSNYSARSATIGSTFVASRAGIQQASSPIAVNRRVIATNVGGSFAETLNNKFLISRVNPNETARPMATPASAGFMPCVTTSFSTSGVRAPRAMRMPISCMCCATEYDITPYM